MLFPYSILIVLVPKQNSYSSLTFYEYNSLIYSTQKQSVEATMLNSNMVQVEFFLDVDEATSIHDLHRRLLERFKKGERSKLVVRFYDMDMTVTPSAVLLSRLNRLGRHMELRGARSAGTCFGKKIHAATVRLYKRLQVVEHENLCIVTQALHKQLQSSPLVAIEQMDNSFRLLREPERQNLLRRVRNVESIWTFIFKPTHLLADRVDILAAATV